MRGNKIDLVGWVVTGKRSGHVVFWSKGDRAQRPHWRDTIATHSIYTREYDVNRLVAGKGSSYFGDRTVTDIAVIKVKLVVTGARVVDGVA